MTNRQLKKHLANKLGLRTELRSSKFALERLRKKVAKLEEAYQATHDVKEVYKGFCLNGDLGPKSTHGYVSSASSEGWERAAHFWQNVNDHSDWRIELELHEGSYRKRTVEVTYFLTREEALTRCKEWIAFGRRTKCSQTNSTSSSK